MPSPTAARRRIARLRLSSQGLSVARASSPVEAVGWMLALQGQDYPGVQWSVGLRVPGATLADVEAACDRGEIVRSWPLRGTLHLVRADDLPWLLDLTATRAIASAAARRDALGITLTEVERAREVAADALPGRTALSRAALLGAIEAGGVSIAGQRGYHLLWYLAQTGTLVLGPTDGRQQTFVRLEAWVPRPRRLERDEALGELALRFFRSHGPATVEDLVRWSGLTVRDIRRGVAVAGSTLTSIEAAERSYLIAAEAADVADQPDGVRLLPGFDEYVLGYRDRTAVLAPEFSDAIVPGGNGMFRATIVEDGEVVGTWSRTIGARRVVVEGVPFAGLSERGRAELEDAAAGYGRFVGRAATARVMGSPG